MHISKCQLFVYNSSSSAQLLELSRFQYYFNYDHMFNSFYSIKIYSCEVLLILLNTFSASVRSKFTFQHTFQSFVYNLYSITHYAVKSKILLLSLLHSMSRDSLQSLKSSFNMTVFAHQHNNYT
jgi:hypothetical protein